MSKFLNSYKDLISEWHCEKNQGLDPKKIAHKSSKKVWWKCKKGHEWQTKIYHRTYSGSNCPYCSNRKVCNDNCLSAIYPEIAKEWSNKNKLKPNEVTAGSHKKVWWKCKKGHEWNSYIYDRTINQKGCPYCCNKKVCKDNCLATTHPHLAKEWSSKNKLKPTEVVAGSNKKAWWKCQKGHEWKTYIIARQKYNCPYCSGRKACYDNCLSTTYPEISKEWSNKNKLKPNEVVANSGKKYWWKCQKCKYEWKASLDNRAKGRGCPVCKESKGEKKVAKTLDKLKIRYKREYIFFELGLKRFDFALFRKYARKPYAVIEYHGEQHYKPIRFGGTSLSRSKNNLQTTKQNDKIKKQFCKNNNIQYIEIPYTNYNKIDKIIRKV